jgi:anti-sigma-K factor RskA
MSGARPETPEELEMLAGEYVLGVLASAEMRAADRQATDDPRLAREIAGWERRLAPMLTAVAEVAPPDALWTRIQHAKSAPVEQRQEARPPPRLTVVPPAARPRVEPAWPRQAARRRVWPWQVATAASLALAAALAAFIVVPARTLPPIQAMAGAREISLLAVLTQPESRGDTRPDTAPQMATDTGIGRLVEPPPDVADPAPAAGRPTGFLAATWPDGTVVLTALAPMQIAAGKALELWIQPPDAAAPRSLGVLPAAGRQMILPAIPAAGSVLSVSLEPAGGSTTGAPSGRVVYAGTLRRIGR